MTVDKPASDFPSILVIIVTWNKKQYVLNLLESFQALDYPRSALDVLVIDNASEDDTVEAIRANYPDVRLICNPENIGGTGGFNTGLQWAFEQPADRYRYLWLLDNDVELHSRTLSELVDLLEAQPDAAVAGSTMMQLDFPWRLNEMGAFVDRHCGELVLNRHLEEIAAWKGLTLKQLRTMDVALNKQLMHCRPYMDVDYVAAASLLIRADVAREIGLWRDFFIHFDDVEWCLRITRSGRRILVSARSLIWHLSAAAKVPTWVLYYDNRNVLYLVKDHGNVADVALVRRRVLLKALYYTLVGHAELAELHIDAVDDFTAGRKGKKDIRLATKYRPNGEIGEIFRDPSIRRVLVPWSVNMQAGGIQAPIMRVMCERKDLEFHFLLDPLGSRHHQLPKAEHIFVPRTAWKRWLRYVGLRGKYDLVLQSDYRKIIPLSWLGSRVLFVNDEGFYLRTPLAVAEVWQMLRKILARWAG